MSDSFDDGIGEHVVELTSFRGAGVRPVLAQIEGYWEQVRGQRLAPGRSEIDPRGIEGALGHVFVLERIAKGLARFRIGGSHLTELMGLEVRGMPLSAVFQPEARAALSQALHSVFDDPAVVRLELDAETGFGCRELRGDMILMPLKSDLGEISRVLGAIVMAGEIGRAPRRLGITGQSHRGLTGYSGNSTAPSRGKSELDERGVLRGQVPPKTPENVALRRNSVPTHLRLVSDNTLVD